MHTILVVDDAKTNINILLSLLGDNYDILVATNGEDALEIARQESVNLILLDIIMPNMDGFEVCKKLKADQATKDIPVIFLTAKSDEDSISRAYDIGGIDYVTKPFKSKELLAKVIRELKLQDLIKNLEYISSHDTMTGVYNRRKFFELATKKMSEDGENLSALMIDIDDFKSINDTYGHDIGDIVIKSVASTLKEMLDEDAIVARLGGEEFAVVCILKDFEEFMASIEKLKEAVASLGIDSGNNEQIKVTVSIGVAQTESSTKSIDELLKNADLAMYHAKNSGKNRVVSSY